MGLLVLLAELKLTTGMAKRQTTKISLPKETSSSTISEAEAEWEEPLPTASKSEPNKEMEVKPEPSSKENRLASLFLERTVESRLEKASKHADTSDEEKTAELAVEPGTDNRAVETLGEKNV